MILTTNFQEIISIDDFTPQTAIMHNVLGRNRAREIRSNPKISGCSPCPTISTRTNHGRGMAEYGELAGYVLDRELGRGTMGTVYLARRSSDPTELVAVKRVSIFGSEDDRARLRREAEIMRGLDHRNIMPVLDVIEDNNGIALVMPFAPGGTLAQRLRQRPLSVEFVVELTAQIADALAYAHARGVLHRDVKPSNIVFTEAEIANTHDLPRPGAQIALLTDFGIARDIGLSNLTRTDLALGTAAYLDPNLVDGGEASALSDQYALGIVAYQSLIGRLPFTAATPLAVLRAADRGDHQVLDPHLFGPLADVIERMFHRIPSHRFRSLADVASALRSHQKYVAGPVAGLASTSAAGESPTNAPLVHDDVLTSQPGAREGAPQPASHTATNDMSARDQTTLQPASHTATSDMPTPQQGAWQPAIQPVLTTTNDDEPSMANGPDETVVTRAFRRNRMSPNLDDAAPSHPSRKRRTTAIVLAVIASLGAVGGFVAKLQSRDAQLPPLGVPALPKCNAQTSAQCVTSVARLNAGLKITFANGDEDVFGVGLDNDALRVNNWFCGEPATLALYRPSTGVIYYANNWPVGTTKPTEIYADSTGVRDAVVGVGDHNDDGCADIALDKDGKRTWFIPVLQTNRLRRVPYRKIANQKSTAKAPSKDNEPTKVSP